MGIAIFIVLDGEHPDIDTFVDGKALARERERLEAISKALRLPSFDDFVPMPGGEAGRPEGGGAEAPGTGVKWHRAEEGLAFVQAIASHIRLNPGSVKRQADVLDDLAQLVEVLEGAKAAGARWHFSVDA